MGALWVPSTTREQQPVGRQATTARRRAGDHRGASLVEFAFIMPLLFMLIIGMITGGITLSRQNSVENAVREGTRFGAVNPKPDLDAYLEQVLVQVEDAATGDLANGVAEKQICVAFVNETNGARRLQKNGAVETFDNAKCFEDKRTNEARVQVKAHRESEIQGVFWSMSVDLDSQSVTRYER